MGKFEETVEFSGSEADTLIHTQFYKTEFKNKQQHKKERETNRADYFHLETVDETIRL